MLTTLVMVLVTQLPMNKIIDDKPVRLIPPPAVVIQEKIVIKKIYVMVDKFGAAHENEDRVKLLKEVEKSNKLPFQMQDKHGKWWEHQDKDWLKKWIDDRNLQTSYLPVAAAYSLNC